MKPTFNTAVFKALKIWLTNSRSYYVMASLGYDIQGEECRHSEKAKRIAKKLAHLSFSGLQEWAERKLKEEAEKEEAEYEPFFSREELNAFVAELERQERSLPNCLHTV
jgi:hypothetical protein